jgi:hypothetical protein
VRSFATMGFLAQRDTKSCSVISASGTRLSECVTASSMASGVTVLPCADVLAGVGGGRSRGLELPVDRQTDKQTDRQTDKHTCRQTDRQTDRHTDTQTDRQTNIHADRQTDIQTDRQT